MTDHDRETDIPEPVESGTRRATGMGEPGTLPSERSALERARLVAGGRLEEAAHRVRELGESTAARKWYLEPTRPLADHAAARIDTAADYVRTREVEGMRSDLTNTVARHPLVSITIAFAAGYALRRIF
jgi:hypothetical protein